MGRLFLFVALGAVVACSGGGDTDDGVGEATCDGNAFTLRINGMSVATPTSGFDLDDHDTQSTDDSVGCGKVDGAGGVDNALSSLESSLSSFGLGIGGPLGDAVTAGDLVIDITVAGYDGGETDDCVLLDLDVNDEVVVTSVESSVTGGVLDVELTELPLQGEIDMGYGPMDVDITARAVVLSLPLAGSPVSVTNGLMGAGLPWDEPGNDKDMRSLVEANVGATMFPLVEGIMVDRLDLQPPGAASSADCDAISSALTVNATSL
ncbi:MAG: hypothetical protein JRI25_07955 [Deltaproteobacteria bacterium]|nr:hypothetical protein [Deltaproteobacteria bacterium]MBW2254517.1 hypothetical protein [Deltaproteobacteria bacterium]